MNHQFHTAAREAIAEIVELHNMQVESCTREQLIDLIFQMIKSGDITKHASSSRVLGKDISYVPYREVRHLRAEVDRLSELLQKVKNILR